MDALEQHLARQAELSRDFFWNRLRWELVSSELGSECNCVVDVGAGPGFLGEFLRSRRPQVDYWFVEPIEDLERRLTEEFGEEANRRDRDFHGASHVTLMDVLEHQEDDRTFMAELAEKMEPGATLLLTVPAMPWLWSDWDAMLGHYRRYTKKGLRQVVDPLPLQIEEQSYIFPELIPPGLLRRARMRSGDADPADAEFPQLPKPLNETLYRVGKGTMKCRRVWPAGTSLYARLRRVG
ncbi:MAG TPA: methyltransferase domain-containing protein [Solirubrobacterales bacterium]|nr:methyltransferase domain-containing protein [Solirubrobacterales bacterium]